MDSITLQEKLNDFLILAARTGNITEIEKCLASGAQINGISRSVTALMAAAEYGHAETVRFLIANGAPLHTVSGMVQNTALIYAAIGNHTTVVDSLIRAGADIHCQNGYGSTALLLAITCKKEINDMSTAFRLLSAMSIPEIIAIQDNIRFKVAIEQFKEIVLKNQKAILAIFGSFNLEIPMRVSFLDLPIELMTRIFSEAELFEQWYDCRMGNDIHFISKNRKPMTFSPVITQSKKRKAENDLEETLNLENTDRDEMIEETEEIVRKTKKIKQQK